MARALTVGLAVMLVVSIGLNIAARRGPVTRPPFEYFPDMARTARYNAFEANPNFPDGSTLRVPPPGTIPRGLLPLTSEAVTPPGTTPENPFKPDDAAAVERGQAVFETFCVPCHGAKAEGDGLVVQHGFPAPPTLLRARTRGMSDAQIFGIISNGSGGMPSYATQIAREDRWKAVLHVRKLQNP
ncbi:MAG TPA: c-type cytochrome [Vicinamibacterales bacterium]|jgi:mono/diheme cytochrome c family protein